MRNEFLVCSNIIFNLLSLKKPSSKKPIPRQKRN
jgi:hypothetical protein